MILSVVVVSYNSRTELESCFPAIQQQVREQVPDAEFIVIDNASTDGGSDYLRANFPGVNLQVEPVNLFFAAAANRGVALARGELVLLLNPDVAIDHLGFAGVLSRFRRDPLLFALQPRIQDPRDGQEERLFFLAMRRGIIDVRAGAGPPGADPVEIPFATGAAAFFRRSRFLELGGFDRLFSPFYWEDVDLGVRAVRSGLRSVSHPSSRFLHRHSTIIRRHHDEREIKTLYERNRLLFFYKHASLFSGPFLSHLFWLLPRLLGSLAGDRFFLDGMRACWALRREARASRRELAKRRPAVSFATVVTRFRASSND